MSATYDEPIYVTYSIRAGSVASAAALLSVAGPENAIGRVVSISSVVTTGVTAAATDIVVGDGTTTDLYATLPIPISSANAVANAATIANTDANPIVANSRVVIGSGGAATAGAVNADVTIAWF